MNTTSIITVRAAAYGLLLFSVVFARAGDIQVNNALIEGNLSIQKPMVSSLTTTMSQGDGQFFIDSPGLTGQSTDVWSWREALTPTPLKKMEVGMSYFGTHHAYLQLFRSDGVKPGILLAPGEIIYYGDEELATALRLNSVNGINYIQSGPAGQGVKTRPLYFTGMYASPVHLAIVPDDVDVFNSLAKVGIRTTTPQAELDVVGTVRATSFTGTGAGYTGSGAGLTSLNADNISAGTVTEARLTANVALLSSSQTFTGAKTFNNAANSFAGSGVGLTGLNGGNISSGTIATARLGAGTADSTKFLRGDQTWSSGMNTVRKSSADQVINGTAYQDITGLSFPVVADTDYAFEFTIVFSSANGNTGFGFSVNGPSGPVYIDYVVTYQTSGNATASTDVMTQRHDTAYNAMAATTSTVTAGVNLHAHIKGTLRTGTSVPPGSTLSARVRSELANNDLVVKRGSWGTWF